MVDGVRLVLKHREGLVTMILYVSPEFKVKCQWISPKKSLIFFPQNEPIVILISLTTFFHVKHLDLKTIEWFLSYT